MSGNVTFQNVVSSLAPRSIAASSRWRREAGQPGLTVTTTKLMLNMMWAIRIVMNPLSGKNGGAPIATNSVSSEAPRTISGVAIGRKMNRLVRAPPAELVARQGQRDERPEDGRDDRREQGDRRC